MDVLCAHEIGVRFGAIVALDSVTLHVGEGEIVAVLGPNGAGKSTLFKVLCGVIQPDRGRVEFGTEVITAWPLHRRARAGIGWLPQHASVLPQLTSRQHIEMVPGVHADAVVSLLDRFDLLHKADIAAGTLSGGERRRLELARCLALGPKVLLLDEPFAGVDPHQRLAFSNTIRAIADTGVAVVLTDHSAKQALDLCDRAMLLEAGVVGIEGTSLEVRSHPEARARYLGHDFC